VSSTWLRRCVGNRGDPRPPLQSTRKQKLIQKHSQKMGLGSIRGMVSAFARSGYGATAFACRKARWLAEPKLARRAERSLVDQSSASWNPLISWLCRLDQLRSAA
jgi:hypothetical protein